MRRIIGLCLGLGVTQCFAFTCYLTLAKDSCWTNYDVTVNVLNATTSQLLGTATVPRGKSWDRISFPCTTNQELKFNATYSPVFWKSEVGHVYHEKQYVILPSVIDQSKEAAWNIPLCFAEAFASVPMPPEAAGDCHCDFSAIPPVKL